MAEYVPSIDYTSRDYSAIRADLINNIRYFAPQWLSRDSSDLGIVLLELYAYMGDIMSFYIDRSANEALLPTASQRDSVLTIAKLLGYNPGQGTAATVDLVFENTDTENTVLVPPRLEVSTATIMNSGVAPVTFETMNTTDVSILPGATATIPAAEGTTVTGVTLSASFNGLPSQAFVLPDTSVDVSSIRVFVDSTEYARVDNLLDYPGTALVFSTSSDALDNTYIEFGDNVGGRIPRVKSAITAEYRVIAGTMGNVIANTLNYIISNYSFADASEGSGLGVTNPAAASGGADPESTTSIRINAPKGLKAVNRAVTAEDFANLAIQVTNVGKTYAEYVGGAVNLYMGLVGEAGVDDLGDPTTAWLSTQTAVETALEDKKVPTTSVTVIEPTLVPVNITVAVPVRGSYKNSQVLADVSAALSAMLSYQYVGFNQDVTLQMVYSTISNVPGVANGVSITKLSKTSSGAADVTISGGELPVLGTLNVTTTGGI